MKAISILLIFSTFLCTHILAQEGNQWFVSDEVGVDFNCAPPHTYSLYAPGDTELDQVGNYCTSIADTNGNLLFYATVTSIYNRNKHLMPHGKDSLQIGDLKLGLGTYLLSNSIFTIPDPGDANRFYVFFLDDYYPPTYNNHYATMDINYAIVDMGLDHGLGDIVEVKRNILANYVLGHEMYSLSATRQKNKRDFWVASYRRKTNPGPGPDSLIIFSITPSGVAWHKMSVGHAAAGYTAMEFSPDGKRIAMYEEVHSANAWFVIYDFNKTTGNIYNPIHIHGLSGQYSLAFSADNTKMYAFSVETGDVVQYDITSGNDSTAIAKSAQIVAQPTGPNEYYNWYDLRLGPDNKIYGINDDEDKSAPAGNWIYYLRCIGRPNETGAKAMVNNQALEINLAEAPESSPGFLPHFITRKPEFMPYNISSFCNNSPVIFTPFQNLYSPTYHWDFGDPGSGTDNASTQRTGIHLYKTPGTYKVHFVAWNYDSIIDTFTRFVCISAGLNPVKMDANLCSGEKLTLDAGNPGTQYLWNTGDTTETKTVGPGIYWVSVTNGSCTITDTAHIINVTTAKINLGHDTTIANGQTLTLHSGYPTTVWSTGDTGESIEVTKAGTYWAALKGDTCETSDTIKVGINSGIDNENGNANYNLSIVPNPSAGNATIIFSSPGNATFQLSVSDINGKIVSNAEIVAVQGQNTYIVPAQNFKAGEYVISLESNGALQRMKFIKQ